VYLIDTNIILELLCNQQRASEVQVFFKKIPLAQINLTDFSLYSLGIFLFKGKKISTFQQFINDMLGPGGINIIRIPLTNLPELQTVANEYNLDFDDAYQYIAAKKFNLALISFDSDFNQTPEGKKTPSNITMS
jgi:hypothetical protein